MKCVAIGDMFVDEQAFHKEIEKSGLFDSYQGFTWKGDLNRVKTRALIRKIETEGSEAYPLPEDIRKAVVEADVVFVHLCPIGQEVIQQAKHLQYIVSARGGLENIAVKEAQAKGIHIIHCPAHNAHAVAELVVGLMICETRNVARANYALKQGEWRENYPNSGRIRELRSSSVGIIGFGTIGRLVVDLLQPFHTTIYVNDPFVDEKEIKEAGCIPVSKEDLLKEADIVTLHGRIGPNDPPIIGAPELALMKPTSYLINTARAVLVDMDALVHSLEIHQIMGAAIDVFPKEPLDANDPITKLDNITITNHRGGDTVDSYIRSPELLISYVEEAFKTGKTRYML